MKKSFRRTFAAVLCLVMLPCVLFGCRLGAEDTPGDGESLYFQHTVQDREVGVTHSLIHYDENYAYGVHYPQLGADFADKAIKSYAESLSQEFIKAVGDYSARSSTDRAILTADYYSYLVTDADKVNRYASVVFEIKSSTPAGGALQDTTRMSTLFFDLKNSKQLGTGGVFKPGFEVLASEKVKQYFASNRLYSDLCGSDSFKLYTSAKAENFEAFAIDGDKVVFYFSAGTAFPVEKGCVEAQIDIKSLKSEISSEVFAAAVSGKVEDSAASEGETKNPNTPAVSPSGTKYIAFTFDDGPHNTVTNRILDVCEKTKSRVTFFVLGTRVGSYTDTLKRAHSLGCEIGNHSYSHADFTTLSKEKLKAEVNKTNTLIEEIIGEKPTLFRVPYGSFKGITQDIGMPLIQWSIDTEDWKHKSGSAADKKAVVDAVLNNVRGGEIVLMHDLYGSTADCFEQLVPELIKRGFVLVTVSELYEIYNIELEAGGVYRGPATAR